MNKMRTSSFVLPVGIVKCIWLVPKKPTIFRTAVLESSAAGFPNAMSAEKLNKSHVFGMREVCNPLNYSRNVGHSNFFLVTPRHEARNDNTKEICELAGLFVRTLNAILICYGFHHKMEFCENVYQIIYLMG